MGRDKDVEEISVAILAGGQSRRMGQDKAFLPVGGRPVIERVIECVARLSDDVTIITNEPDKYRRYLSPYEDLAPFGDCADTVPGARLVGDVYPGKGSLGGIYTGIRAARHPHCLVVACDMPFLNAELLRYLMSLTRGCDVVIPRINEFPETMHALYGKRCLEPIERRLLADRLKVVGFFDEVRVRYVEREDVARFDPNFRSFLNMNTPTDWELVQQLTEGE